MKTFLQLLIAFVWVLGSVIAQGPLDFENLPLKHNISAEMQVVAIPRAAALPLMKDLLDPGKIEPAYERVQQMLIAGTAKLVGWPTLKTHSASRATAEGVSDFRYATEFAGGGVDIYLTADGRDFLKQDTKIKGVELNVVPKAFETLPLGLTLELEPILLPDGQTIEVNVVARNLWLKEMRLETIERSVDEKITVEQPVLGRNVIHTSLSLKSGQRILLGSFANSETPGHMELFFLKVDAAK